MSKSFRICFVEKFLQKGQKFNFSKQGVLKGIAPDAETTIHPDGRNILTADFEPFVIDHQYRMERWARFNGRWVQNFITRGEIQAYRSPSKKLLFLCGQRDVVEDFTKTYGQSEKVSFNTVEVDMNSLLISLPEINLAWFRFPTGRVKASALMGRNIEGTRQFRESIQTAIISTLSFEHRWRCRRLRRQHGKRWEVSQSTSVKTSRDNK